VRQLVVQPRSTFFLERAVCPARIADPTPAALRKARPVVALEHRAALLVLKTLLEKPGLRTFREATFK